MSFHFPSIESSNSSSLSPNFHVPFRRQGFTASGSLGFCQALSAEKSKARVSLPRGLGFRGQGEMRPSFCRSCLACHLKLLNFLQTFVGVSIIIYSLWILSWWNRNPTIRGGGLGFDLDDLPAPWFVCTLMGIGILLCLIAFTGHIAAEAVSSCCLCFVPCAQVSLPKTFRSSNILKDYAVLTTLLILLEAALVGYLLFNKHWEEDLPFDPTGQLKRLRAFIEDNIDIFKWAAVTVVVIQALSLLVTLVLRVMIPTRRVDYDSDEDFLVIRRPLLHPQDGPTFPSASIDNQGFHSDIWSSRMRQKYGLNQSESSHNPRGPEGIVVHKQ